MRAPPGAIQLLLAYGAGLATGLARFPDPRIAGLVLLAVAALQRRAVHAVLALVAALGVSLGGMAAHAGSRTCASQLADGKVELALTMLDSGPGIVPARSPHRCGGTIRVRLPNGATNAAGDVVAVTGRWVARRGPLGRADGLLVAERIERTATSEPSPGARVRDVIAARAARLYGARAPLVDALVTGRRSEMSPELKDAFVSSGLVHLLSISGFHIGLIAAWILLGLRVAGVRRHRAEALAATAALAYVAFLGWPAPAARAGWLLALAAWCRWRQRRVNAMALLGAACLIVTLADPWAIVDLGGWLSACALAGSALLTTWSDRAVGTGWGWRTLAASIGATLGTAPITALAFGQVALIGIVLNFVAIPLAAAAVPAVFVSLIIEPVLPVPAAAFAAAGGALLAVIEQVALVGGAVPLGQWHADPGPSAMAWWILAVVAVAIVVHGRATAAEAGRRAAWIATSVGCVSLVAALPRASGHGRLSLHFLAVGQGDAAAIRTPNGRWVMVDAGPLQGTGDAGRRVVVPFLRRQGARRIDVFVLSHAHRDHVGGAGAVFGALPVSVALDPAMPFTDSSYVAWLSTLPVEGTRWRRALAGDTFTIDGVTFRVLHPPPSWPAQGTDLNEDSIVLEVTYGSFRALLTGDAGFPAERRVVQAMGQVDLLKVGHHGSRGSTGDSLLRRAAARAAVISLGRNRYGHPAPETLARLRSAGVATWRTDRDGTVRVETDGRSMTVRGTRTTMTFPTTP